MGKPSTTPTLRLPRAPLALALLLAVCAQAQTPATTVPLLLPSAIAYDAQGNLYIAESANHDIRKVDSSGNITTIAGTGVQGYSGDNGPAVSAELDSPQGIALDANRNIYLADTHNHRVRKISAASGTITTIAGTGAAGFAGDNGPATAAQLDLPTALAIDANQNLYIADTRNHHIRKIDAATGIISTIAGDGTEGFAGDNGPATAASLDSPTGLAVDAAGNLYLADTHNQRVRRIDHATGIIATVAGTGTPGYSGDSAAATAASLALPRGITIDGAGNIYIADTRNNRIRRIDTVTGKITTVAGDGTQDFSGDSAAATTASLDTPRAAAISSSGLVTLADTANQRIRQLDSGSPANIHTIAGLAPAATVESLNVAAPSAATYGSGQIAVNLATGTPATGNITFRDTAGGITTTLATIPLAGNAAALSTAMLSAGTHNITATYAGDATHSPQTAAFTLTIAKASSAVTVSTSSNTITTGQPVTITARASSAAGTPTGTLALLDNSVPLDTIQLPPSGQITLTTTALAAGSHTLTAVYSGDNNFTSATSSPAIIGIGIGSPAIGDFALATSGAATQTVVQGNSASYNFTAQWQGTPLSSPITLSATGLPSLAKASFNPAYLPPGAANSTFTLTISTAGITASAHTQSTIAFALLLLPIMGITLRKRHKPAAMLAAFLTITLAFCSGCGSRVYPGSLDKPSATPYTITVTGTATTPTGVILQHTATVTLLLQQAN